MLDPIIMQHAVFLSVCLYIIEGRLTQCGHGKLWNRGGGIGIKMKFDSVFLVFPAKLS